MTSLRSCNCFCSSLKTGLNIIKLFCDDDDESDDGDDDDDDYDFDSDSSASSKFKSKGFGKSLFGKSKKVR